MAAPLAEQLTQFLNSPARRRLALIGLVGLISLAAFGSLIYWNSSPDFQVLFSNLSAEDAGEIVHKLKEKKVPFQLSAGGSSILVAGEQVYDLRLALAAEGLPKGGGVGFEVFDRTSLGATDFVQKLNYQRALQGELGRTIRQIREVEQARVHIVTPKESLFLEEQKKPTASVFLKTRSGMKLSAPQVEGIVHLVASAVEGLEPGSITVVDTSGKILSKRADLSFIAQLTTSQLEYQRNLEEGLKKKVQGMLEEVLGQNKAIARVSAEIDFQQIDITEERFDPQPVIRSEQKSAEKSSSGAGMKAGETKTGTASGPKPPGAKPGAEPKMQPPASSPLSSTQAERQSEVRNYEISRINKHIKGPVGSLKRISVAVIVDGVYKEKAEAKGKKVKHYVPRAPEEMKSLENVVKRAIGYNEARGDQVEVIHMPFNWTVWEDEEKTAPASAMKEFLLMAYKPAVSLLLALLFIFFVLRPLLRRRAWQPVPRVSPPPAQPLLSPEGPQPLDIRGQTLQIIQGDPAKTVGVVKSWLNERE